MKAHSEGKHLKKSILVATMIIGANIIIFQGLTQAVAATEYNKTNIIPTSYASNESVSSLTMENSLPEGYKKAEYTVGTIDLPYYNNQTPPENDITKEAAAELAAQYLWQVYGVDLEGQTLQMGYNAPTTNTPRPMWIAEVNWEGQDYEVESHVDGYGLWFDAFTGELYSISMNRALKEKVSAGPDWSLDVSEYEEVAKKLAEKYNIVRSAIQSIQCTGQGSQFPTNTPGTYGEPTISFQVDGENGEVALMTISRYDKALLGVMYNGQYRYDLQTIEEPIQEWEARLKANEARQGAATDAGKNKKPALIAD